jgi:predicted ester cyclase
MNLNGFGVFGGPGDALDQLFCVMTATKIVGEKTLVERDQPGELLGVDPTGRPIAVKAISIFRIADGKIAEEWTVCSVASVRSRAFSRA